MWSFPARLDSFPGGCLPSMELLTRNVARRTDLQAVGLEGITDSYMETMRRWRHNFAANPPTCTGSATAASNA
jgi:cyclopropane fatty-acyl-phospholipid synthase-like methyltransferase